MHVSRNQFFANLSYCNIVYRAFVISAGLEFDRREEVVLLLTWIWVTRVCSQTALENTPVVSDCAAHSALLEHSTSP